VAGAAFGALLGAVGNHLPDDVRAAGASVLAVLATVVGILDLGSRRLRVLQIDRETSRQWPHAGAFRWALLNGSALGVGATSRLGFWLWYVVPSSALLLGDPTVGAVLYGVYGLVRGFGVWGILLLPNHVSGEDSTIWLLRQYATARLVTAGQLIVVGMAVVVAVGF
jgi:hypothetical protein